MNLAPRAMDAMIKRYMFLVSRLTNKYKQGLSCEDMEDLKIDCMVGLNRSIEAFDEKHGYTLQAIATKYIRGEISNYFQTRRAESFKQNNNAESDDDNNEPAGALDWSSDYYLTIDIMLTKRILSREDYALIHEIARGYTYAEIGKRTGVTRQWIGYKVSKIKAKIAKANALPVDNKPGD